MQWYTLSGQQASSIAPDSRAFLYGDGFFTTIKVFHGTCQLFSYHLLRVQNTADALGLKVHTQNLQQALAQQAKALGFGVIKLHVSRQALGTRGYAGGSSEALILMGVQSVDVQYVSAQLKRPCDNLHPLCLQPAKAAAILTNTLGLRPQRLSGLKTLDRLEQVLLANEFEQVNQTYASPTSNTKALAEGLVCSIDGLVREGVSSNVFFYLKRKHAYTWCTPQLSQAGVAGTLRAAIMAHTDIEQISLSLGALAKQDIAAAFFCNAVRGLMPVTHFVSANTVNTNTANLTACSAIYNKPLALAPVQQLHEKLCGIINRL